MYKQLASGSKLLT